MKGTKVQKIKQSKKDIKTKSVTKVVKVIKVKDKMGRPWKVKKDDTSKVSVPIVGEVVKRGRGRPRKVPLVIENVENVEDVVEKKQRGRPPKYPRNAEVIDISKVKTTKFIGYCNKCKGMIVSTDLEIDKKFIYVCPKCGCRYRENELVTVLNDIERPLSKKEFLENTIAIGEEWTTHEHIVEVPEDLHNEDTAIDSDWS